MDLMGIAAGAISAVNDYETVAVSRSTGYAQNPDGTTTPTYSTAQARSQVQPLTSRDLRQIQSLNLQGTLKRFYFYGEVDAIVRQLNKGGDLVTRSDGTVWKTTTLLEEWPDWCALVCTLQDGA